MARPRKKPKPRWQWDNRVKRPVDLRRYTGIRRMEESLGTSVEFLWPHHCLHCHHSWPGRRASPINNRCPRCNVIEWWHIPGIENKPLPLYNMLRCPICFIAMGTARTQWLRLLCAYHGIKS